MNNKKRITNDQKKKELYWWGIFKSECASNDETESDSDSEDDDDTKYDIYNDEYILKSILITI